MYIIAIAWLYTVMLISIAQPTVFRGVITFLGTGLLPLALFLYLFGTPQRRRNKAAQEIDQLNNEQSEAHEAQRKSSNPDQ